MEDLPLNLYVDIEGSKETNPDIDIPSLFSDVIEELKFFLLEMNLAPNVKDLSIVTMDSSTNDKFSKHLVIKIPDCLFKNNYICGALMRNFHAHLINRFGPPETNKFYLNPEKSAKSNKRVCLVDFAVYTKNRDFRLIGSCKRKGCETAKHIRWLWLDKNPSQLTKEVFFKSLVQRNLEPVKYYITRVIDTINDGIPMSSSLTRTTTLRTVSKVITPRSVVIPDYVEDEEDLQVLRIMRIGDKIANWILSSSHFSDYFRHSENIRFNVSMDQRDSEMIFKINFPGVRYCRARSKQAGYAVHKSNTIYFVVYMTGIQIGEIQQFCASQTCLNSQLQRVNGLVDRLKIAPFFIAQLEEIFGKQNQTECLFLEDDDDE